MYLLFKQNIWRMIYFNFLKYKRIKCKLSLLLNPVKQSYGNLNNNNEAGIWISKEFGIQMSKPVDFKLEKI